ncbi:hypothetical protein BJ508DRAFT_59804 [Ascobolus immersus RN42]|uniref:PHD-type domain-containing protein n=1 Tax=Ascobolus immersus RN42 TaxID=1160509 RepID=A0A3N4INF8_ASCIM|nr:hypothetical protein BJ508DRAFT_59804 [Ascobolus immersus RN42]
MYTFKCTDSFSFIQTAEQQKAIIPSEETATQPATMESQATPQQAPTDPIQTPARKVPEPLTISTITPASIAARRTPGLKSASSRSPVPSSTRTSSKRKPPSRPKKRKTDASDTSSDEEFTMEGKVTKSGRAVHRPSQYDPAIKTPTRKRPPQKKLLIDTKICKICQRGHSPNQNMIVFCDGCNAPYHQLCHNPPIDEIVIQVPEAEWFCAACSASRGKKDVQTGLSGHNLTHEEKRTYLSSLSQSQLIDLLFFCEKTHPSIPFYSPHTKSIVQSYRNRAAALAALPDPPVLTLDDMVVLALDTIADPKGSPPKVIFEYLATTYPSLEGHDIRAECTPVLQRLLKNGRLLRENHMYRVNHAYVEPAAAVPVNGTEAAAASGTPSSKAGSTGWRGIKLPEEEGEEWLVEREPKGFSHVWSVEVPGVNGVNGGAGGLDYMGEEEDAEGEVDY